MQSRVDLQGKTALVTGAAKRLGAATSLALARAGAHVVVHYRRSGEEAAAVVKAARDAGVQAWPVQADLAEPGATGRLFAAAVQAAGPIDFLINSASIFPEGTLRDCSPADIHENVTLNALVPMELGRLLAAQERDGCIINFLDTMIQDYDRRHVPYHLSKRMLYTLTRMMAAEFAPRVRVSAVAPGLVLPPEGQDEAYLARLAHSNPLNRYADPECVTDAVLFLLRSAFVTGQVIYLDGGRHLRGTFYG